MDRQNDVSKGWETFSLGSDVEAKPRWDGAGGKGNGQMPPLLEGGAGNVHV